MRSGQDLRRLQPRHATRRVHVALVLVQVGYGVYHVLTKRALQTGASPLTSGCAEFCVLNFCSGQATSTCSCSALSVMLSRSLAS